VRSRLLALGFALATLVLAELVWGYRFETNDDLAFAWLMWGREGLAPQGDFFWFFRGGLGQLLSALLQVTGPAGYTWFYAALLTLALARWFQDVLGEGDAGGDPDRWRRMTLACLGAAVLAWVLQAVNFTRVTLVVSYLPGYRLARGEGPLPWRDSGAMLDLVLVVVAWLIRPKAALLGLALAALHRLVRDQDPRALGRTAALVLVLATYVAATDWAQTSVEEREYIERQPYTNILLNQGLQLTPPPGHPLEPKLRAIQQWFLFDAASFHTDFLRDNLPPLEELRLLRRSQTATALGDLADTIWQRLTPWLWVILLFLFTEQARGGGRRQVVIAVAEAAAILAGLGALAVLVWMRDRVLVPVLGILVLGPLARVANTGQPPGASRRAGVVLAVVLGMLGWTWWSLHEERRVQGALRDWSRREAVILETALADKVILATRGATLERLLSHNDPRWVRLPDRRVQVLPLQGWMSQNPVYQAMVDRLGGGPGAGVAGMLETLRSTPERFVMIGEPRHVQTFLAYVAAEYGLELLASPILVQDVRLHRLTPVLPAGAP
jgi:hypothetical protein